MLGNWNWRLFVGLNASLLRSVRLSSHTEPPRCAFILVWCSEDSSPWTRMSAVADCSLWKSLSSSSLWKKQVLLKVDYSPVTEKCLKGLFQSRNFEFLHLCLVWLRSRPVQAGWHDRSSRDPHWFFPGWCSICSSWLPPLWDDKRTHAPITVCCVTHQSAVREGKGEDHGVLHVSPSCSHSCIFG